MLPSRCAFWSCDFCFDRFSSTEFVRSPTCCLQVERLLKPDLFNRPAAVLAVAIAGSNIGESVPVTVDLKHFLC